MATLSLAPETGAADGLEDWLNGDTLTGDWGGLRTDLHDHGIDFSGSYIGETAGNPIGGNAQGAAYAHQIVLGSTFDLDKLLQFPGTKLNLQFAEYAGQSLSAEKIGNLFAVQEAFVAQPGIRLGAFSIEQPLFDTRLDLKVGRLYAGDDFGTLDIFCNFQSLAFCSVPEALLQNSGLTVSPIASWGGRVKFDPIDDFYVEAGAYEVNPSLARQGNGFKLSTTGATGAIVPVQIGWEPKQALFGLPGSYILGGYYDTSDVDDVTDAVDTEDSTRIRNGRWGLYILGQQTVYQEAADSKRGLTLFMGAVFGDSRTAEIQYFAEGGLSYQGTFKGRDNDTVNLAFARGQINNQLINAEQVADRDAPGSTDVQSAETVIELNYGAAVTPWFELRPGVQYVIDPNADHHVPNAFVLGLQTTLQF